MGEKKSFKDFFNRSRVANDDDFKTFERVLLFCVDAQDFLLLKKAQKKFYKNFC